jgi:hypothetical protein
MKPNIGLLGKLGFSTDNKNKISLARKTKKLDKAAAISSFLVSDKDFFILFTLRFFRERNQPARQRFQSAFRAKCRDRD